ncbi:MAG: ribonuclease HII [Patescibacteria group bacterium]
MHIHHGLDHIPKRVSWIIGIDEAGRGPVAGPLTVGLVMIKRTHIEEVQTKLPLVRDSKKLSPRKRESVIEDAIDLEKSSTIIVRTIFTDACVIDTQGISQCLYQSIEEGLQELIEYTSVDRKSIFVYLDGSLKAPQGYRQQTVTGGDNKIFSIALASIYAKVARDKVMEQYDIRYPAYDFYAHKGYGTVAHMKNIKTHGLCPIHRRSFLKKIVDK